MLVEVFHIAISHAACLLSWPPQGKSEPSGREVACSLFGVLLRLSELIETSGSTRYKKGVNTVRVHVKTCVSRLYVEEMGGGLDQISIMEPRKNWQAEYYNLMKSVTSELNAAYAEYEAGNSSGLPYEMYERFVELLQKCRAWMKEPGVVLITEEEYA